MKPWKVLALVAGTLLILAIALGVIWWKRHGPALLQQSQEALAEGETFGRAGTAEQCVNESIRRLDADSAAGMLTALPHSIFLKACAEVAPQLDALCAQVSSQSLTARVGWSAEQCRARGARSPHCPQLLQILAPTCKDAGANARGG